MAWIELHQSLPTHWKTKKLGRLLKIKLVAQTVGHLVMLWTWALDNAPDGDLSRIDAEDIAEAAGWPKSAEEFVAAMQEAGWIDPDRQLHDWEKYGGRLQVQRKERQEKERDRKARYREKKREEKRNAADFSKDVPRDNVGQSHGTETDRDGQSRDYTTQHYTTQQDSTEQDTPPLPPASGGEGAHADPDALERQFEEFWTVYPKKQGKGAALKAWRRIKPDKTLFEQIIASVQANISRNEQWKRDGGQYIPNPATWLNQTRWLDEVPAGTSRNATKTAADYAGGGRPSFTELAEELAQKLEDEAGVSMT